MIEIRPIVRDEGKTFLTLLCDVFQLQLSAAEGVFFHEPFFDLTRKWALFEDGEMQSILTTTPLQFGWGSAIGIAGVATRLAHQGRGLAGQLLARVLEHAEASDEAPALLFAHRIEFYQRHGFVLLDEVVRATISVDPLPGPVDQLTIEQVQEIYNLWASKDPNRLVRDDRRWRYWQWVYRHCEALAGGYLCNEPLLAREVILAHPLPSWPLPPGSQWVGLDSMRQNLGVPTVGVAKQELLLMGRNFPALPQMFMTDQF